MNRLYLSIATLVVGGLLLYSAPATTQTFGAWVRLHGVTLSSGRLPVLADVNNPSATDAANRAKVVGCVDSDADASGCAPLYIGGRASTAGPTSVSADGDNVAWRMSPTGEGFVAEAPSAIPTFSVTTASFTPPATPTDLCVLGGASVARNIRVLDVRLVGTATAARIADFYLVKRSTANTVGTFVAGTVVPHSGADTSIAPTVGHYTANPTLGSTVGTIARRKIMLPIAGTVVFPQSESFLPGHTLTKPILLRAASADQLSINYAGAALVGGESFSCSFTWSEEAL